MVGHLSNNTDNGFPIVPRPIKSLPHSNKQIIAKMVDGMLNFLVLYFDENQTKIVKQDPNSMY